jgi:hypothetical protein
MTEEAYGISSTAGIISLRSNLPKTELKLPTIARGHSYGLVKCGW